ncbi:MAG: DNA-processing protein DprA [Phycisphaerales bacterium]|nr:DNA-processing protein DprA [Phycisphaerales bacterium]
MCSQTQNQPQNQPQTQINDVPEFTYRLAMAPGIGPATWTALRHTFGDDRAICHASIHELMHADGVGHKRAVMIHDAVRAADVDADRDLCRQFGVELVLRDDSRYPAMLAPHEDAPMALWVRGEFISEDAVAVAIVGSRKCTAYGRLQAGRFSTMLAEAGMVIVSGGALGIDGEAHHGALRIGGRTIAVLGCGMSKPYPRDHGRLFDRIAASNGVVISEHPMLTPPRAVNFPRRNRLIAGLSLGVIVIEASLRSGALITARLAAESYGREVMALPGRVDSPASAGCLALLRDGGATMVRDVGDVLEELKNSGHLIRGVFEVRDAENAPPANSPAWTSMRPEQRAVLELLAEVGAPLLPDAIASRLDRPLPAVMADLTALELSGVLARDHRGLQLRRGR